MLHVQITSHLFSSETHIMGFVFSYSPLQELWPPSTVLHLGPLQLFSSCWCSWYTSLWDNHRIGSRHPTEVLPLEEGSGGSNACVAWLSQSKIPIETCHCYIEAHTEDHGMILSVCLSPWFMPPYLLWKMSKASFHSCLLSYLLYILRLSTVY